MSKILTDLSPATLVRANRANLYEFFRHFENSPYFEFAKANGMERWSCSLQYAWFNAILCARDAAPADGDYIEDSLAYFKAKNTSDISLWLEDGVDLASWEALLTPRGFKLEEGPYGMSMDLNRLKEIGSLPSGAEIKIVADEKSVQDCAEAIINGYGFPPDWKDGAASFVSGLGLDGHPYRSYVTYWEEKPVSTAGVFFGEEVAGIYTVATVPEARGKGFGAAVTLAPLLDARKMGYRVGTLQASQMGYPVYKRMGFKEDFRVGSFFYSF
jgi:GNAT superfamily N-acetyltransferase